MQQRPGVRLESATSMSARSTSFTRPATAQFGTELRWTLARGTHGSMEMVVHWGASTAVAVWRYARGGVGV
jgi:hypothetical protein